MLRALPYFLVALALAGCATPSPADTEDTGVAEASTPITSVQEWEVGPSAQNPRSITTVYEHTVFASAENGTAGALVEFVPDVPAAPPALVHRFALQSSEGEVNASDTPQDGVYRVWASSDQWMLGPLKAYYYAGSYGTPVSGSVASKVTVYATIFFEEPAPDFSAIGAG